MELRHLLGAERRACRIDGAQVVACTCVAAHATVDASFKRGLCYSTSSVSDIGGCVSARRRYQGLHVDVGIVDVAPPQRISRLVVWWSDRKDVVETTMPKESRIK